MIKAFKRWWRPVKIEYRPESVILGEISTTEIKAMWPELSRGYEDHKVFMAYTKWLLQKQEARLNAPFPLTGDPKEEAEWNSVKRDAVSKADAFRSILYSPRLAKALLEAEQAKKEEETEPDHAEYWKKQPFIPN